MPIPAGTRLGPFEVITLLGAGGMGEVYRARDPRLDREVAIKALPPAFALDPERLARFEREAKLLASLSHPNVAGIHGLEVVGSERYLVLEFVPGESLEARLQRGALGLDEVLDVGRQVAAGVEAAHEAGVVHRDLKPGNVMLAIGGAVKVLDFGLAKAGTAGSSDSDPRLSASPTMTYAATQAGVILGTAAYMSPEQARGKAVDRRTDIWSFGCLLYECLTGRRPFDGETVSDVVARILEREPDWSAIPPSTPPRLLALLRRCLTKDARQRLRDMGDARIELDAIAAGDHGEAAAGASALPARATRPVWVFALGVLAVLAVGATVGLLLTRRGPDEQAMTLTLLAPPGVSFGRTTLDVAISPDGRQVVFVGSDSLSGTRLWVRGVDRENARPLEQTENAGDPFWSPDGRQVGFFAGGKLRAVNLATGSVRSLADAPLPRGGAWGRGRILYQPRSLGPLWTIPEEGGTPEVATQVDSAHGDVGHRFPQFLPDGRHFVATVLGKGDNVIAIGVLGGPRLERLFEAEAGAGATVAGPDWLIAPREGAVRAQRVDVGSSRMHGPAFEVPGLRAISPDANGSPVLSASGTGLIIQRAALQLPQRLLVMDREGHTVGEPASPEGIFMRGNVSPDGRRAAYEFTHAGSSDSQIWVADLVRGGLQPYTFDQSSYTPVFSPDGTQILFSHEEKGSSQDLWVLRADAPGSARLLRRMEGRFNTVLSVAPDGHGALLRTQGTDTQQDLVFVTWGDSVSVRPVLTTRFNEPTGAISPDGHWLAYVSDESGQYECRVRAFPQSEGRVTVVSRGAYADPTSQTRIGQPVWRRDGHELLFVAGDGHTITTVAVTPGNPPAFGEPHPLFRLPNAIADIAVGKALDRFVLSITREEEGRSAATVLLRWPRLLESRK